MRSNTAKLVIALVLVAAGYGLVFGLSNYVSAVRPPLPEGIEDDDLALQGSKLKNYSLGFNGLMADWYWMQSLQYVGNKLAGSDAVDLENLRPLNPRLLYPLLDNATSLDPHFTAAYSYGAVVLPAIDPAQAIAIAEKGIANNPDEWRIYQHLGYIYWRMEDYEKASDVYLRGSKAPGAPLFMQMMAARMKTQGGSRETAREMYREMADTAEDSQTRENAEFRLLELDWLDERDAIRPVMQAFRERNGRCIAGWREIVPSLRGVRLPGGKDFRMNQSGELVDPTGVAYEIDAEKCDVKLGKESKLPRF